MRAEFEARFGEMEARLVRLEIWLKVLAGIMSAGFTLLTPAFTSS
ncbi:hypothetical protein [Thermosulfurimonas sp.]|nr:hypothetical protein [Thermosulfurimonas sp.]